MTCRRAIKSQADFIDPTSDPFMKEHLAACQDCREEARLLASSWESLGLLESLTPSGDFRARFWARVRREEVWGAARTRIYAKYPLAPAMLGFFVFWVMGVVGGLWVFESRRSSGAILAQVVNRWISPYPQGSIEKIFLEGRTPVERHGGNA